MWWWWFADHIHGCALLSVLGLVSCLGHQALNRAWQVPFTTSADENTTPETAHSVEHVPLALGGLFFWGATNTSRESTMYPKAVQDLCGWRIRSLACGYVAGPLVCARLPPALPLDPAEINGVH